MSRLRKYLLVLVLLLVGLNVLYLEDPWLWRRYVQTLMQLTGDVPQLLTPSEPVTGDGSFILPVAAQDERTISPQALQAAESFAARFDSYALIILHKGVIQTEWYAEGWDETSLTQSQSMHKSVLAILIGTAIEAGIIGSIEDPVGRYIPEWDKDPRGDITLHELMIMSSGLAQYTFTLNPFTDDFRWLYSGDTKPVVLRTPIADWRSGDRFDYNNINAELLGMAIEGASGQRYADYLEQHLWAPLGGDTALVWLDSDFGKAFTSCCLMATARDWARVGLLMLNRGRINDRRIVTAGWIDRMVTQSPVSMWYGLQTWLAYAEEANPRSLKPAAGGAYSRSESFLARDVYYFSGRGAQRVYVVPSYDLVIVRLGPALGPQPLKVGWDNVFLVNGMIRSIDQLAERARAEERQRMIEEQTPVEQVIGRPPHTPTPRTKDQPGAWAD